MDPIGDMFTTLINAQRVGKKRVALPYSRFKEQILELLKARQIIGSVRLQDAPIAKLVVALAYDEAGSPRIHGVRRLSKPGSRVYATSKDIPYSKDGLGMVIVSTPEGLMDDTGARRKGMGGELIGEIW
jgi:small subunit ribosomal protein S8